MMDNTASTNLNVDIFIREGLRLKFLSFWGQTFEDLLQILKQAEGIEGTLMMYAYDEITPEPVPNSGIVHIHLHQQIAYNIQLAFSEIIDDYWAAYLCFLNGFTKQSHQILRSTLELLIELLYLVHLHQSGQSAEDNWTARGRGIEHIPNKIETIKVAVNAVEPALAIRLSKTYDLLCTSTHSHKDRMMTIQMPRSMWASDCPSFEPTEVLYTRGLFLSVLSLELPLIKMCFDSTSDNDWEVEIIDKLSSMLRLLEKYNRVIQQFDMGYLVHKEHIILPPNRQVLYSVKLDGKPQLLSRNIQVSEVEGKALRKQIEARLFQDKI